MMNLSRIKALAGRQNKLPGINEPMPSLLTQHKLDFMSEYTYGLYEDDLGKGSYGRVYKIESTIGNEDNRKQYAVKEFTRTLGNGLTADVLREISILVKLDHPNIIKLIDVAYFDPSLPGQPIKMILELALSSLEKYIKDKTNHATLTPDLLKSYMYQLSRGLDYMHNNGIWHRDIKPQNILVFENGKIVFTDFGIARFGTIPFESYTTEVQTLWWRAPELLLGSRSYGPQIDVFSLGIVFANLWVGSYIFDFDTKDYVIRKQISVLGHMVEEDWPGISGLKGYAKYSAYAAARREDKWGKEFARVKGMDPRVLDIIKEMTYPNPSKRVSIKDILDNPYFDGMAQAIDRALPAKEIISREAELNSDEVIMISPRPYPTITTLMYRMTYERMLELSNDFRIKDETYFHSRILFDYFLEKNNNDINRYGTNIKLLKVAVENLGLISIACLFISSKVLEKHELDHLDLIRVSNNMFNADDLYKAVLSIVMVVEFNFVYPTVPEYLYYLNAENKDLVIALAKVYSLTSNPINSKLIANIATYIVNHCYGKIKDKSYMSQANQFIESIRQIWYEKTLNTDRDLNNNLNLIINAWPNCRLEQKPEAVGPKQSNKLTFKPSNTIIPNPLDPDIGYYSIDAILVLISQKVNSPLGRDELGEFIKELLLNIASYDFIPKISLINEIPISLIDSFANYLTLEKGTNNQYMVPKVTPNRIVITIGKFEVRNINVTIKFTNFPTNLTSIVNSYFTEIGKNAITYTNGTIEGYLKLVF